MFLLFLQPHCGVNWKHDGPCNHRDGSHSQPWTRNHHWASQQLSSQGLRHVHPEAASHHPSSATGQHCQSFLPLWREHFLSRSWGWQISPWWLGFPTLWGTGQVPPTGESIVLALQLVYVIWHCRTEATGRGDVISGFDHCLYFAQWSPSPMYRAC